MGQNPQSEDIYDWLRKQTQSYFLTVVFGSYARGNAHSTSDVDVLLIDNQFDGWNVYTQSESEEIIDWKNEFPPIHIVCTSKEEFESRYKSDEEMISNVVNEGFSLNKDWGFVDYIKTI